MAVLRNNDVQKLTKDEALKKLHELQQSLLELEKFTQKKNPIKKAIARLHTYLHNLNKTANVGAKQQKKR